MHLEALDGHSRGPSSHGDIVFGGYDMMGFLVHAKSSRSMEGKMGVQLSKSFIPAISSIE